ncbi:MAG: cell division protein ZapB [Thermodesulfobacteriota bacterium]
MMADLSNFEKLEGRIDNLIKQSTFLKEENKILLEKLNQKDQDIHKLTDNIEELHKERTLVFDKVVGLIDKLEDI